MSLIPFGRAMASVNGGEWVEVDADLRPRSERSETGYERLPEGGTVVLDRPDTDDGSDVGEDDWYAIKGEKRWSHPCGRAGFYMSETPCPHRILVWDRPDDPTLKKALKMLAEEDNEQGEVVAYEKALGPCVSFYEAYPA